MTSGLLLLNSTDVPQANDPARVLALARSLATGTPDPGFDHPRDRSLYTAALRILRALNDDDRPTPVLNALAEADPAAARQAFTAALAASHLGRAWIA